MLKGSSGFYCYAIFEHNSSWPAHLNVSEARLAFKLNADMLVVESTHQLMHGSALHVFTSSQTCCRFKYMAISDDIQRYMPSEADRDAPRMCI